MVNFIETEISSIWHEGEKIISSPDWVQAIGAILALGVSLWISSHSSKQARQAEKAADDRIVISEKLQEERNKLEAKEKSKKLSTS